MSPVAQCDGLRPKCSNCQGKNAPCEYRDDGDLSKESKEVILEMTRTLTQLPATSRMRILQELADESNAWTILSTLRQKAADYRQDPNDASASTMSSTDDETCDLTQNWESQNPVAYPDREVLEPNMTQLQQLTRLSAQQPELSPCQMQSDWYVAAKCLWGNRSYLSRPIWPVLTLGKNSIAEPRQGEYRDRNRGIGASSRLGE